MRIFSIVGARPQFIKLAPFSDILSRDHEELIVHTGQHYDYSMSEKIFSDLGIRDPDFHLETGSGSHARQTGQMMEALEKLMVELKPQLAIVFGDTNTTLAGALAASKLNIPIVHVEAGLRSYNRLMPEEINRVVADHVSEYLFAPTLNAYEILAGEGLKERSHLTGDIMVDTIRKNLPVALEKSSILRDTGMKAGEYNLLTLHRNYNVDDPAFLESILSQVDRMGEPVLFPVHPRTKKMLGMSGIRVKNISFTDPVGYIDFIAAEYHCRRIITDSGGIQKEAYILKRPCITLRTETEWTETVREGWNLLIEPSDTEMCEKILSFTVPESQKEVFGKEVSKKMAAIIYSIATGS